MKTQGGRHIGLLPAHEPGEGHAVDLGEGHQLVVGNGTLPILDGGDGHAVNIHATLAHELGQLLLGELALFPGLEDPLTGQISFAIQIIISQVGPPFPSQRTPKSTGQSDRCWLSDHKS